jgi:2-dehydropantoate 2-reductase
MATRRNHMQILIVGPGAMGCLFAARLHAAGFNAVLFDYNPMRARQINNKGIMVEGVSGTYNAMVPVITELSGLSPDIVLICVKSHRTGDAAESLRHEIPQKTLFATLQNGLGNVEILKEILGENRVIGGVTSEGATSLGVGKIRHAGTGSTVLGPAKDFGGTLEELVSVFNRSGFSTTSSDNVDELIWGKLIVNVGINALTAITGLKNGRLPEYEGSLSVMKEAVAEAVAVSKAKKIKLAFDDPFQKVLEVCRATAGNIASMLQDVLNKRPTEVVYINGAICKEGEKEGIPTPVNRTLTHLVKTIQASYHERL